MVGPATLVVGSLTPMIFFCYCFGRYSIQTVSGDKNIHRFPSAGIKKTAFWAAFLLNEQFYQYQTRNISSSSSSAGVVAGDDTAFSTRNGAFAHRLWNSTKAEDFLEMPSTLSGRSINATATS